MTEHIAEYFRHNIGATGLEQAGELLAETASALGWRLAAFHPQVGDHHLPRDGSGEILARKMGWPADYASRWEQLKLGRDCPVGSHCQRVSAPFCWRSQPGSEPWLGRKLLAEQREALAYYQEYTAGALTVPVHRPGARTGYVSWFTNNARTLRRLGGDSQGTAHLVSHLFIQHLDALGVNMLQRTDQPEPRFEALTDRETECLAWAARGKTEEEIGMIILRSQATARFHLRNAMRKLDASNRTHAVAKACTLGLISVHH